MEKIVKVFAIWYGGYLVLEGKLTTGDLSTFILYVEKVSYEVWSL